MIFFAVAGPTPSSVSSCSRVAVLRLIGCAGAVVPAGAAVAGPAAAGARRGSRRPHWDEDLATVLELRRAVDLAQIGACRRAAGALERVLDALARRQAVDAGVLDRARDVDDHATPAGTAPLDRDRRHGWRGRVRSGSRTSQVPGREQQQEQCGRGPGGEVARVAVGHVADPRWAGVTGLWRSVSKVRRKRNKSRGPGETAQGVLHVCSTCANKRGAPPQERVSARRSSRASTARR